MACSTPQIEATLALGHDGVSPFKLSLILISIFDRSRHCLSLGLRVGGSSLIRASKYGDREVKSSEYIDRDATTFDGLWIGDRHEATHGTPNLTSSFFFVSYSPTSRLTISFLLVLSSEFPERPMKVEIVLDPARAQPAPTLSQRVGPAPDTATTTATTQSATRGRKGLRGRGGRKKRTQRPAKSAEDLDAEMADYTGATTTSVVS